MNSLVRCGSRPKIGCIENGLSWIARSVFCDKGHGVSTKAHKSSDRVHFKLIAMTSYVMEPSRVHATLKEKASRADVYLPRSHIPTQHSRAKSEPPSAPHSSLNFYSAPELSVVSEDGQVLGIDVHTGLPKLAVELLPEMEEGDSMGAHLNRNTRNVSDASATPSPNPSKRERKSVSFDTNSDLKRLRSMSESKVSRRLNTCLAVSKLLSFLEQMKVPH